MICTFIQLVLLLLPALTFAQQAKETRPPIGFEFRGYKLGQPIDESALVARGYRCMVHHTYDRWCVSPALGLPTAETIGDRRVRITYHLMNGALASLSIDYGYLANEVIREAFTAKWGPPHEVKEEVLQNALGARFTREVARWRTRDGELTIKDGINKSNGGEVSALWEVAKAKLIERQKQEGQAAEKDL
jgi:hypothetical protein